MKKIAIMMVLLLLAGLMGCAAEEGETELPAGYVLVTTATQSGWLALPTDEDKVFPLAQLLPDGTDALNVIHLMPNGVYMEDASCANHDCVGQGEVTLENVSSRILGNMIICLPNQVILQLYTPEEAMALLGALPGEQAEDD